MGKSDKTKLADLWRQLASLVARQWQRRPKLALASAGLLILLALAASGLVVRQSANAETSANIVILSYDDQQRTIPTAMPTVGKLLDKLGIKINQGDVVEPAPSAKINQDKFRINIYRAQPVEIVDGIHKTYTMSAAVSPRAVAAQDGIKVYAEDDLSRGPVTNFADDDAVGDKVVIDRATPVKLMLYGQPAIVRTQADTVGDLVKEKKIALKSGDALTPAASTPLTSGMSVAINHKGTKYTTQTETIPTPVKYVSDASLSIGTSAIRQQGSPGQRDVTYFITTKNGHEVARKIVQKVVTVQPVEEVVALGTAANGGSLSNWLSALRRCESGGNYQDNTGNGFYGAYQFMASTWQRIGYSGLPNQAAPAVQDQAIIKNTNLSSGGLASQNPGCYQSTGISAFPPVN